MLFCFEGELTWGDQFSNGFSGQSSFKLNAALKTCEELLKNTSKACSRPLKSLKTLKNKNIFKLRKFERIIEQKTSSKNSKHGLKTPFKSFKNPHESGKLRKTYAKQWKPTTFEHPKRSYENPGKLGTTYSKSRNREAKPFTNWVRGSCPPNIVRKIHRKLFEKHMFV